MDEEDDYVYEIEDEEEYKYDEGDDEMVEDTKESYLEDEHIPKKRYSSGRTSRETTQDPSDETIVIPFDSYEIRPLKELVPLMNKFISDLSGLFDVSSDEAQLLLMHFKWDKEKLLDAYFNDAAAVRKAAGIDLYSSAVIQWLVSPSPESQQESSSSVFSCRIRFCCEELCPSTKAFSLGCGHRFCRACYREYLINQVGNGGVQCLTATCPEVRCRQAVARTVYETLLATSEEVWGEQCASREVALAAWEKYSLYGLRNFVETSKVFRYCPGPPKGSCDQVALGSGISSVTCTACHTCFCFKCGHEEAHDPCACSQLAAWLLKCVNESETANWILANTRKCPSCTTRIEKNQGCNHMSCRQCKHEFCWICLGAWSEHGQSTGGFYKCNRFETAELPVTVNEAQRAKAELDRYLHYYQRYHAHDQGLLFAEQLREHSEQRMLEQQELSAKQLQQSSSSQQQAMSWMDVQFLKQAAEQVKECRRCLKYTYVLGYYLSTDQQAERTLFEHHQEMLEKHTERLQEFTELPLEEVDRSQVVNLTRVTERFMQSLLQSMSGGVVRLDETMTGGGGGGGGSSSTASATAGAGGGGGGKDNRK